MGTSKTDHPFQPGVAVALFSGGWGPPRPVKRVVSKVHKTGNFLLEGSDEQWRAFTDKSAMRTGKRAIWDRESIQVWSAEHDEMLVRFDLHAHWRKAVDTIVKAKVEPTAELISAIQDVVSMIEGRSA